MTVFRATHGGSRTADTLRRTALASFLAVAVAACGFQLRGGALASLNSLHLSTAAPSQVATEIRRQLFPGPTRLVPTSREGQAHLRILSESTEKSILTLTSGGRVFDYQLRLRVGFQIEDPAGKPLVEPTHIEVRRVLSHSETAPLAKEAEERFLFGDMRAEAASQILRRVAVVHAHAQTR